MIVLPFYIKWALGALIIGFLFHLIGFTTPYWVFVGDDHHFGLWTTCYLSQCHSYSAPTSIGAARAFEVLACLMFIVVFILIILYLKMLRADLGIAGLVCTFVIVVLIIIGVICFTSRNDTYLHWSFAFTVIGAIFAFIAAIFLLLHRLRGVTTTTGGGTVTSKTTTTVTRTVVVR